MTEEHDCIVGHVLIEDDVGLLCEFTQDIDHPVDEHEVERLFKKADEDHRKLLRPALEIYADGDEAVGWAVLPRFYLLDVNGYPVVAWRLL